MSTRQPDGEFAMPIGFERFIDVEVKVFGFENRDLFPIRESKKSTSSLSLDILLLYESDKHHYIIFKDLTRFFCFIKNRKFMSILQLCWNCLYLCNKDLKQFKDHVKICGDIPPAVIRRPEASNNLNKFNNWSATGRLHLLSISNSNSFKPVASCATS